MDELAGEELTALVGQGRLHDDGGRVSLSRAGKNVADGVVERRL